MTLSIDGGLDASCWDPDQTVDPLSVEEMNPGYRDVEGHKPPRQDARFPAPPCPFAEAPLPHLHPTFAGSKGEASPWKGCLPA